MPWAITASQPWSSSHRASATVVALDMSVAPVAADPFDERVGGQTEVEADDGRAELLDDFASAPSSNEPPRRWPPGPARRSTPSSA